MTALRFIQVDAFADRPFGGNPAAVMPLDTWLDDATMQAIAAENNISETAFIVPSTDAAADYELRWFTPTVEVALCGHATLATGHVVLTDDPARNTVRFVTRQAGTLVVNRAGGGYTLDLPAWPAAPADMPGTIVALGGSPVETLWRDGGYAVIVYGSEREIRALAPDFAGMEKLGKTLFIATAPGDETDIVSRVFAPDAGIPEDPVTGSAHAVLAPYWAVRLGRNRFTAYQASARGGRLDCELTGDRVILGGRCVTVIEGVFRL
jgi:predicted PhzF superfamily epimerase YddE/YHI9